MAMNTSPTFPDSAHNAPAIILASDGINLITLFSGQTDGSRIKSLSLCTDDEVDVEVRLWKTELSVDCLIGCLPVPAQSGYLSASPAVDGLDPKYLPWVREDCIMVETGETVKISVVTTLSAGKKLYAYVEGGDY